MNRSTRRSAARLHGSAKGLRENPEGRADPFVFYDLGSGTKTERELVPAGMGGRGTRRVGVSLAGGTPIIDPRYGANRDQVWRAVQLGERLDKDVKKALHRDPPKTN